MTGFDDYFVTCFFSVFASFFHSRCVVVGYEPAFGAVCRPVGYSLFGGHSFRWLVAIHGFVVHFENLVSGDGSSSFFSEWHYRYPNVPDSEFLCADESVVAVRIVDVPYRFLSDDFAYDDEFFDVLRR